MELKEALTGQKGKLKQKFTELTGDNLMFMDGKKDEMFGEFLIRHGKTREELNQISNGLKVNYILKSDFRLLSYNFFYRA